MSKPPRYAFRLGWRSLRRVCPWLTPAQARALADALGPAFATNAITTPKRAAAAVAQLAHESDGFRTATEYASGAEYEGRRDLGNTQPGDGRRFKGRGYVQITGRSNYAAVGHALGHDFVEHPDDLAKAAWAAKASCWWWRTHGLNQLADQGAFDAITQKINGGQNGAAQRRAYWTKAKRVAPFLVPQRRRPT